jgi:hypothetical protein
MHGWLAAGLRIEAQTKHGINAKVLQKSGLVGKMVETRWCGLTGKKFFRLRLTEDYQRWYTELCCFCFQLTQYLLVSQMDAIVLAYGKGAITKRRAHSSD